MTPLVMTLLAGFAGAALSTVAWIVRERRQRYFQSRHVPEVYKDVFDHLPSGILVFSPEGSLLFMNQRARRMISTTRAEISVGMRYRDYLQRLAASGNIVAARRNPDRWIETRLSEFGNTEQVQELKTGSGLWLRITQRCLPEGHVAFEIVDTTIERQRERDRQVEKRQFRELAELSSDWFWESDTENRMTSRFGGRDSGDAASHLGRFGQTRYQLAHPEDKANEPDKWSRHQADLDARRPFRDLEYDFEDDTGRRRRVRVSGNPTCDEHGEFLGYRGVASDITAEYEEKRRAELAHQRLFDALEAIPISVAVFDKNDRLRMTNSGFREMLSTIEHLLETGVARHTLAEGIAETGAVFRSDAQEEGVTWRDVHGGDRPWELYLPDGRCFLVHERRTEDGSLIVTGNDVSELKRQTWELLEKSSVLQGTLDNIDQGLVVFGSDYRLIAWNERFFSLLEVADIDIHAGISMHDTMRKVLALQTLETGQSLADIDEVCRRTMACDPPQISRSTRSGRILDFRQSAMPDGGVAITCTDITDMKLRERDLERKSSELEVVFESMDYGIAVIDADMTLSSVNDRMAELLELPDADGQHFVGMSLAEMVAALARTDYYGEVIPESRIDEFVETQLRDMAPSEPIVRERRLPSGTVLDYRVSPIKSGGWLATCRDITRQRQNEAALRDAKEQAELANRAKSEFLANTSHELRTPLNAIIGFSEILMKEMFGPLGSARYVDYVTDINDSGQHLLDIINDLLDLAKVEAGHLDLHEEPTAVKDLVESALRLVRDRARSHHIALRTELTECLASVFVDERAIKQVLINLLSNAVKFTPEGGQVSIATHAAKDGTIEFKVSDTGIGMAREEIPKALAPFGQIDGSMSRRYHGTGLGLPLASRLTELHGGELILESEPGVGTTVTVRLPSWRHVQHVGKAIAGRAS